MTEEIVRLLSVISNSKRIAISTHINPDGDAIGSALGLYFYIVGKGIEVLIINPGDTAYNLKFLPGENFIHVYNPVIDDKYLMSCDTIIIVDLNDITRLRSLGETIIKSQATKVVVDHHLEPKEFADLYIVDTEASSAGEIVCRILNADKNYKLSQDAATALYVAIMTDTGSFRFPRTTGDVHRIIGDLIDHGADPVMIYDEIYNREPLRVKKLFGYGISAVDIHFEGKVAIMSITKDMFNRSGAKPEEIENFVEKLLSIDGVRIGILLCDEYDQNDIRISFRSKGEFGIRELAQKFGGGGHFYASGARVNNGKIEEVKERILEEIGIMFT
jgi:phosphoesterase RecJ-like protein